MEKHGQALYVVSMNFTGTPEQEREFNAWYNSTHVPDVVSMHGFLAGTRYEAVRQTKRQRKYIAVYEIENEDLMNRAVDGPLHEITKDFTARYLDLTSDWSAQRWRRIGP